MPGAAACTLDAGRNGNGSPASQASRLATCRLVLWRKSSLWFGELMGLNSHPLLQIGHLMGVSQRRGCCSWVGLCFFGTGRRGHLVQGGGANLCGFVLACLGVSCTGGVGSVRHCAPLEGPKPTAIHPPPLRKYWYTQQSFKAPPSRRGGSPPTGMHEEPRQMSKSGFSSVATQGAESQETM